MERDKANLRLFAAKYSGDRAAAAQRAEAEAQQRREARTPHQPARGSIPHQPASAFGFAAAAGLAWRPARPPGDRSAARRT